MTISLMVFKNSKPNNARPVSGDRMGYVFKISGGGLLYSIDPETNNPASITEVAGEEYGEMWDPERFKDTNDKRKDAIHAQEMHEASKCNNKTSGCTNYKNQCFDDGLCDSCRREKAESGGGSRGGGMSGGGGSSEGGRNQKKTIDDNEGKGKKRGIEDVIDLTED